MNSSEIFNLIEKACRVVSSSTHADFKIGIQRYKIAIKYANLVSRRLRNEGCGADVMQYFWKKITLAVKDKTIIDEYKFLSD